MSILTHAGKPRDLSKIDMIVIHCSATKATQPKIDAEAIDRMHRQRGFVKIGYHFVIKRDGVVETGRALTEVGAHAVGFNQNSIGVCLVGGVDANLKAEDNFTANQWESLEGVVKVLKLQFPKAEVLGHRDLPNVVKACPCFSAREWFAKTFLVAPK